MFEGSHILEAINALGERPGITGHIGIEFIEVGKDYLKAKMPVDERTTQPFGILHGGASVVLAETMGSVASHLIIDGEKYMAVGLEVNANHLKSVKSGSFVVGVVTPIHTGKKVHVWDIRIEDPDGKTVCVSRLTVSIIEKK